ncbi:hypothetical protein B0A55_06672 [Friedmanniomyces simplex]|uniref:Uncharacterized protein n=1 Tax=Friedmanniomyces simplex TaxID=329884 RepID=A0A4U0XG63_9PEZI|nr:hypothetical protein B0A55_06672 [Friedmanniomyces simplex]
MSSGSSSSWNDGGFAFAPNTNTMDPISMPSDKVDAARQKSAAVMAALREGRPGDADALMRKQEETGGKGIVPLRWLKKKMTGEGKKKEEVEETGGKGIVPLRWLKKKMTGEGKKKEEVVIR